MKFEYVLLAHLGIGPLIAFIGWLFKKYPPKEINMFYGYRTSRAMKNLANWNFANRHSAKTFLQLGIATTVVQLLAEVITTTYHAIMIGCVVLVIGLIACMWSTEQKLKQFENDQLE